MSNEGAAPLVGLIGPAGAGKDTVAALLVEHHGFHRVAFADRLRELAERIDPTYAALVAAHGGYDTAHRVNPWVRRRLIEIGDAAREVIGPDVWIDPVEAELDYVDGPVVISDLRYRTEVQWLAEMDGILVAVNGRSGPAGIDLSILMAKASLEIDNSGDIHMLRERVDMIAEDFLL